MALHTTIMHSTVMTYKAYRLWAHKLPQNKHTLQHAPAAHQRNRTHTRRKGPRGFPACKHAKAHAASLLANAQRPTWLQTRKTRTRTFMQMHLRAYEHGHTHVLEPTLRNGYLATHTPIAHSQSHGRARHNS